MAKYTCLNPIAACGLDLFPDTYEKTEDFAEADVALVRSAAMHDLEFPGVHAGGCACRRGREQYSPGSVRREGYCCI